MNKRTLREIRKIQDAVPQGLRDRLFEEVYIAPDLRLEARRQAVELKEEAEALPDGPKRNEALTAARRLQNIIDAGYYDTKEMRVNHEVAKEIDAWIDAELDKAISEGRIPHPKDDKEHQTFIRKIKRNESRKRRDEARDLLRSKAQPLGEAGGGETN